MTAYRSVSTMLGTYASQPGLPTPTLTPLAVTGTVVYTSEPNGTVSQMNRFSVQLAPGGATNGVLSLQVSDDPRSVILNPAPGQAPVFTEIATATVTAGAVSAVTLTAGVTASAPTGPTVIFNCEIGVRAARVVYTNASGDGTVVVFLTGVGP